MAKAVANPSIQQLLVSKAERQFDKDYDVLYHQIKNEVIEGRTLDSYIKELSSESDYNLFNRAPLLTVFVPHGHQATNKSDKVSTAIPMIAVRNRENKLIAYNAAGEAQDLDESIMPSFPVMVVKENERVVYENKEKKEYVKGSFLFEDEGNRYFFANNEFDGSLLNITTAQSDTKARLATSFYSVDPEVRTAYNHSLTCNTCPQRDWVYYGIYPAGGVNEGPMNIKYSEAITSVQFENTNVFSTIGGWDEGNYELYVNIFFSGISTGVFSSMLKVISVSPNDMFQFDSDNKVTGLKEYAPSPYTIVPWDLKAYGNRWAFKVEEYDPEVKKTSTYAHSSTFGTNFKVDASGGIGKTVKVGAEFGTTTTSMNSTNFTYETTDANDILGGAILTWTDPVMIGQVNFFVKIANMGSITTGTVRIGVEPIRTMP